MSAQQPQHDLPHPGIRIIKANALDRNASKTLQHGRASAAAAMAQANPQFGAEQVIYVVRGAALIRWGARLEYYAEAGVGDFVYLPAELLYQTDSVCDDAPLECVLLRQGQAPVVLNFGPRTRNTH
jgi:uncharacterized RmlC-like cupin family protein